MNGSSALGVLGGLCAAATMAGGCGVIQEAGVRFESPAPAVSSEEVEQPSQEPSAPVSPSVPQEAPVPPTPAEPASCEATEVILESSNGRLQEVSTQAYESLDCESAESLESQLLAIRNSPELTRTADEELWLIEWFETTNEGGLEFSDLVLRDGRTSTDYQTCAISVSDDPRAKRIYCFDVGEPAFGG